MCGINGILCLNKNIKPDKNSILKMNAGMIHRGPDSGDIFINKNIALGHRRLSIIDLSDAGKQPMTDNSGRYTMVYNGELYNYKQLKNELENYNFKTGTDSEVLLATYIEKKEKTPEKLDGMFAFAVWDNINESLFLTRDPLGIKPLYYYIDENYFIFSSEIRAILNSELVERKLNKNAISDYLRYQTVHAPETMVKDIKMLMPGKFIFIEKGKLKLGEYCNLNNQETLPFTDDKETVKKNISKLLYASTEKRMMSDVPFGAFLSGGIDSSIIVGLMSQISNRKVNTFSVTFNEEKFSEAKYARQIAKQFNTEHTEIKLSPKDFLNIIPEAIKAFDHPSADGINSYIVSKVTKQAGITMALSGLGGDELFAGYDIFKRIHKLYGNKAVFALPRSIRKLAGNTIYKLHKSTSTKKIKDILSIKNLNLPDIYSVSRQVFSEEKIAELINNDLINKNKVKEITGEFKPKKKYLLTAVSLSEINTYMQNILLRDTDQMSMASSLEVRVPFLDRELVNYVLSIPDNIKFPHSAKQLLTDSVGFLPDNIVNRPKMGFLLPWENWLKNELYDFAEKKIVELSKNGIFTENKVKELWHNFLNKDKEVKWAKIWLLISLQNYIVELKLK